MTTITPEGAAPINSGALEPSVGGLGISVLPGQFLLKDIGLFALSLWAAADSLAAARAR